MFVITGAEPQSEVSQICVFRESRWHTRYVAHTPTFSVVLEVQKRFIVSLVYVEVQEILGQPFMQ